MAAAQFADVPGYSALLLRRTFPDLNLPKALIPLSKAWWMNTAARWSEQEHCWTFPSGATIRFGYCESENDVYRYQGAEFQMIAPDELTQWTEFEYRYLFSRLRRPSDGPSSRVPLRMRPTANPGGRGHDWVKTRFLDSTEPDRVFLPSRLDDNPHLDRAQYVESLSNLDPVTRARLLAGDWDVREQGALIGREFLPVVDEMPADSHLRRVRFWDMAATKEAGCYTVGVKMALDFTTRTVYVENVARGQWDAGTVTDVMRATAQQDGSAVEVDWEEEPGSAGMSVTSMLRKALMGFAARGTKATGPKWVRAQPWASYARGGGLRVLRGSWNQAWLDEVTTATPDLKGLMDQVDATSGAFARLTKGGGLIGGPPREPEDRRRPVTASRASDLPGGYGGLSPFG
jgi:predicted phage terminase large subunit-like protein